MSIEIVDVESITAQYRFYWENYIILKLIELRMKMIDQQSLNYHSKQSCRKQRRDEWVNLPLCHINLGNWTNLEKYLNFYPIQNNFSNFSKLKSINEYLKHLNLCHSPLQHKSQTKYEFYQLQTYFIFNKYIN